MIKILFFGTPDFAVPTLQALTQDSRIHVGAVVTQPDKPAGRGGALTAPPVKRMALDLGIPTFQPHSVRKEWHCLRPALEKLGPFDIGIVVAFGQILPIEVLTWPRRGCVNIHASLLPRWRGAAPIQRSIEGGDSETGVCLMQMEEGLDTGAVFAVARTPISTDDTAASMHDKLASIGAQLLVENLQSINNGTLSAVPQPLEGISYAKKITSEECQVDWHKSAREVALKIRAFAPHPGCHTQWRNRRLKVFRAFEAQSAIPDAAGTAPGTIVRVTSDQLIIQCGVGLLVIEEVQLEGKKRMSVEEFLRGNQFVPGSSLGAISASH